MEGESGGDRESVREMVEERENYCSGTMDFRAFSA